MPNRPVGHRHSPRKIAGFLGWILAVALVAGACEEKNTYVAPPPPKVTVAQPVKKPVTEYMEFTGNIAAVQTVDLRARVEGYLEQVLFKDGDLVKKGDLLFQIEQDQYIAQVNQAKANVARAQAALKQARLTADRRSQAGRSGAISQQQVDEALAQADAQAAEVMSLKAALETAELNLGYTKIYSPFDGRIGRRLVDPGNLVGAGEDTLLAEINQIQPAYVYFTINERALLPIMERRKSQDPGAQASKKTQPLLLGLATDEDYPYKGFLDFAAITLDAGTGTLQLRGVFENPDRQLLPGLFAKIKAPVSKEEDAILVPQQAVGFDQQGEYVMVIGPDDTVERVGVEQGPLADDMRVITKGLKGDEQVIVAGLMRAIPGRKVTPVSAKEASEAASKANTADATKGASAPSQEKTKGSSAPSQKKQ